MEEAGAIVAQLVFIQYNIVVKENGLAMRGAEALDGYAIACRIRAELERIAPRAVGGGRPTVVNVSGRRGTRHAGPCAGVGPVVLLRRCERRRRPALRRQRSTPGLPPLFRIRNLDAAAREGAVWAWVRRIHLGRWFALDRSKLLLGAHTIDTLEGTRCIKAVCKTTGFVL